MNHKNQIVTEWLASHWRHALQGLGIGLGLIVVQGILTTVAESFLSGTQKETWAAAIGEVIMGVAVLGVLHRLGWLRLAAVTTRWRPDQIPKSGWTLLACLVPAAALTSTSWEPTEKIVALAVDYLATGFYEELAFRGLIFVFLARAWHNHRAGIVSAAMVSGVIFGLVHFNPILLIVGPMFAVAFSRLQIDTRTIWISVGLHAAFDWFTEFPFNADGSANDHWSQSVSLVALLLAAILGFRALHAHNRSLQDATMTT